MVKLFFATDVHGSERCFRKFINTWRFYKVDVLILGGDLTGKAIIPIIDNMDKTYTSYFIGTKYILKNQKELEEFKQKVRDSGYYPHVLSRGEAEELSTDRTKVDVLFKNVMLDSLRRWLELCENHLKGTNVKIYVTGGNDDDEKVIDLLEKLQTENIIYCEGKAVQIDDYHEMISSGYSNPTPFKCPRDIAEEELSQKIRQVIEKVNKIENTIFNFHCPPFNSGLDLAPELDENLRPKVRGGRVNFIPCGSIAVRKAIEEFQPLLGLHGHIHESPGVTRIGRTLCINPGSEYTEGILKGAIINLDKGRIKGYALVSG
ncbi:MAG: metallophosphoesterase [Candidatus Bathyarchaeia archaeon]